MMLVSSEMQTTTTTTNEFNNEHLNGIQKLDTIPCALIFLAGKICLVFMNVIQSKFLVRIKKKKSENIYLKKDKIDDVIFCRKFVWCL
jgi:hypothetical protein